MVIYVTVSFLSAQSIIPFLLWPFCPIFHLTSVSKAFPHIAASHCKCFFFLHIIYFKLQVSEIPRMSAVSEILKPAMWHQQQCHGWIFPSFWCSMLTLTFFFKTSRCKGLSITCHQQILSPQIRHRSIFFTKM